MRFLELQEDVSLCEFPVSLATSPPLTLCKLTRLLPVQGNHLPFDQLVDALSSSGKDRQRRKSRCRSSNHQTRWNCWAVRWIELEFVGNCRHEWYLLLVLRGSTRRRLEESQGRKGDSFYARIDRSQRFRRSSDFDLQQPYLGHQRTFASYRLRNAFEADFSFVRSSDSPNCSFDCHPSIDSSYYDLEQDRREEAQHVADYPSHLENRWSYGFLQRLGTCFDSRLQPYPSVHCKLVLIILVVKEAEADSRSSLLQLFEQLKNFILRRRQLRLSKSHASAPPLTDLDFFLLGAITKLFATGTTYPCKSTVCMRRRFDQIR